MRKYVHFGNSTKPKKEEYNARSNPRIGAGTALWLEEAHARGMEVYVGVNRAKASKLSADIPYVKLYESSTYRNPFDIFANARALRNLLEVIRLGDVRVIHCNSPVGGLIGRLAATVGRVTGTLPKDAKIIYTAHGFHFFEGAPLVRGTIYKSAERIMARATDAIVTINDEDARAARAMRLRFGGQVYEQPGIGVDIDPIRSAPADRSGLRDELGISERAQIAIAVGDLISRKNQSVLVRSLSHVATPDLHLLLCGQGPTLEGIAELAQSLGLSDRVHLVGHRNDIPRLLKSSDIFVQSSRQEGLPRTTMEAMAAGLPMVLSDIRGHREFNNAGAGMLLCDPDDARTFAQRMDAILADMETREEMARTNSRLVGRYSTTEVGNSVSNILDAVLQQANK